MNTPKKRGRPANEIDGGSLPLATVSSPSAAVSSATPTSGGHPRNAPGDSTKSDATSETTSCWRTVRLSDYADTCLGKMLDQNKNRGDYYPYLGNSDVRWGTFELDNLSTMRFEKDEHDRYGLEHGDLIVCEGGEPGRCAIWKSEVPGMKIQKALHRIRPKSELDNTFLFYWFLRVGQTKEIEAFFTGTTIKHLTGQALKALQIPLPPLPIQKRIAHILGTLDDKIALNRRINQTLEAMAQALFQSWFVDFEPVKAKQQTLDAGGTAQAAELAAMQVISGKSPAQLKAFQKQQPEQYAELERTAKLFPNKLVESELGLVPEGWGWKPAAKIADIGIGKTPPRNESQWFSEDSNDVKWVSIRDMGESGAYIINTNERLTEASVNKFNVRRIPKNTVLLSFKMTLGRVAITTEEMLSNEAIAHFNIIEGTSIEAEFLYLYLKTFDYNSLGSTSSIAIAVNSKIIKEMPILVPTYNVISRFEEQIKPVFAEMLNKQNENVRLIDSRDSLLPKLLSGEIELSSISIGGL